MPAVDSPILIDFDRCRVLHGGTLVAELDLITGTDARLTNARTPTAHATSHRSGGSDAIKLDDLAAPEDNTDLNATSTAHGLLPKLSDDAAQFLNGQGGYTVPAGTYVHPDHTGDVTSVADGAQTIAALAVTDAKVATANKDGASGTPSMRTLGTGAAQACAGDDARLSDARTPTAHATSHVTGGTDVIANAVAAGNAGLMTGADKTKLDGIATGANLYVHPNHSGDVTSVADGAQTIAADAVTNAKLANMAANSIKGNNTGGVADPLDLTAAQVRTLINVADGATANSSDATLLARANHTGTQLAATISDFSTAVATTAAVTANTAKVTNATHTGEVTGATALTITADAVTYAKMQNISAASRLVGRGSAAGAGDPEEITLGTNLSLSGTTLNAASSAMSSVAIAFTDGDTMRRVTVTDAAVGAASKIIGTIRRPDTTDDSADRGYIYLVNVVRVAAGSFDVLLSCLGWGFDDPTELPPSETVQFYYQIAA